MKKNDYQSPEELAMQEALDRIREEYPDFWKDMDGLSEDTTKPDSEKRQRRKFRRRLIAACFIGVCLLSTALAIFVNSDTAHAVKFAMEKKYYQAKGWVQATDPGHTENDNITIIIDEEEKISVGEMIWEELKRPSYMSDGYEFSELCLEKTISGIITATYQYKSNDRILVIMLRNSANNKNAQLWISHKNMLESEFVYNAWFDESLGINGIDTIINDVFVSVAGSLENDELVKIVNGLE